jgi:hypothetical protein
MAAASSALSLASEEGVCDDANAEGSLTVLWKPGCGLIIAGGNCEKDPVDDIARGRFECMS